MRPANPLFAKSAIALLLLGIGYCSVVRSLASAVAARDPVAALALPSGDARILAGAAQALLASAKTSADRQEAEQFARTAIARDGTAVQAVTVLGLLAGIAGDEALGARWFDYAERLSRRDLPTQFYFIENSVSRGDIAGALRHYDTALRTSGSSAPPVLFPILKSAIADPTVRRELAKTLAGGPIWSDSFFEYAVATGPDFTTTAQLLIEARRYGAIVPRASQDALVSSLVGKGQIVAAWQYYVIAHLGDQNQLLRNGKFAVGGAGESPFDWRLNNGDGVSTGMGADRGAQGLDYRLSPTTSAPVISQILLLPAGKYRLASVLIAASQPLGTGPYWQVKCTDGRSIGIVEMGNSAERPHTFAADMIVPRDCASQSLALVVRASDDVQGAAGQIASISIARMP